jgi:hypothetical protein
MKEKKLNLAYLASIVLGTATAPMHDVHGYSYPHTHGKRTMSQKKFRQRARWV